MIPLARPVIGEEEIQAAVAVLRSGNLVQGDLVAGFEAELAQRLGRRHAVAVSSGTAALHLAMLALGIGPGDEVIVPAFTFPATANAVRLVGAEPVLCDIDPATCNLVPTLLSSLLSVHTRAIMPVHEFGRPADMAAISDIARRHDMPIVEDAACAIGATLGGRPCGSFGEMACFSFHPRKVLTTGEGGAIVLDDDELADRLRLLRAHGMRRAATGKITFEFAGLNYRLTEFQAAIGLRQLARLDGFVAERRSLAASYAQLLAGCGCVLPSDPPHGASTYQTYHLLLPDSIAREAVQSELRTAGIGCGPGATDLASTTHLRTARGADCAPGAAKAQDRGLAIPMFNGLTLGEQQIVTEHLRRALAEAS